MAQRRCLVLTLKIDDKDFESWLLKRAAVHISDEQCSPEVKRKAAQQLRQDRDEAEKQGMIKAGLAEYIDLLRALHEMTDERLQGKARADYQMTLLNEIRDFVLRKAI